MELIEKATKTKFQTDVKHEPIRPKVPKHRREPSPHRYSDNEGEIGEEKKGSHSSSHQLHRLGPV